jgi:glyoxylate/hydroxypyruvate reductase A
LALGFRVNGWSRSEKAVDGVTTFSGDAGLRPFLKQTDILVVLLPLTAATHGIVNYSLLKELRRRNGLGGAVLVNAGRGRLQKDDDIPKALDDGTLKEASLDVFEVEPLPKTSPLWTHPKVFVTPHAAATSDPDFLVSPMLDQMDAHDGGAPLRDLVDRQAGY